MVVDNISDQQGRDRRYVPGFDIGTTYSCAAVYRNGKVEVVPNEAGDRTFPSYVSIIDGHRTVGKYAKQNASKYPRNTLFDAKRLIGRQFTDETIQKDMKLWPFKIVRGQKNEPCFEVDGQVYHAEEISASVIGEMKKSVENYLGEPIKSVVCTVPAYFNDAQRQATKDAAKIAGLEVLRIINEPTAAAMAYGLQNKGNESTVLIFDLGGGTLDVSLLHIVDKIFEVMAVSGDTHLGGEDFDNVLVQHLAERFYLKSGKSVLGDNRAMRRLRNAAENAKRELSSTTSTHVTVESLLDGEDLDVRLTRQEFDKLCESLFLKSLKPVEQVIRDANISKYQVDEIVLVGGSTRIPRVQQLLSEMFNGKQLCRSINPDEAVAYGAAVQGHILSSTTTHDDFKDILLLDVAPLSLGVEVKGGVMNPLIPRNTTIPCEAEAEFITNEDNQTQVSIRVFEGERYLVQDNHLLGEFTIQNIPPRPVGVVKIEIKFMVDENGILSVSASTNTDQVGALTVRSDERRLSKNEVDALLHDAERQKHLDVQHKARVECQSDLQELITNIRSTLSTENGRVGLTEPSVAKILNTCAATLKWIRDNPSLRPAEYKKKMEELESFYASERGLGPK